VDLYARCKFFPDAFLIRLAIFARQSWLRGDSHGDPWYKQRRKNVSCLGLSFIFTDQGPLEKKRNKTLATILRIAELTKRLKAQQRGRPLSAICRPEIDIMELKGCLL
jgi:hypothetical protein